MVVLVAVSREYIFSHAVRFDLTRLLSLRIRVASAVCSLQCGRVAHHSASDLFALRKSYQEHIATENVLYLYRSSLCLYCSVYHRPNDL